MQQLQVCPVLTYLVSPPYPSSDEAVGPCVVVGQVPEHDLQMGALVGSKGCIIHGKGFTCEVSKD